jgi:hypothetical protein
MVTPTLVAADAAEAKLVASAAAATRQTVSASASVVLLAVAFLFIAGLLLVWMNARVTGLVDSGGAR